MTAQRCEYAIQLVLVSPFLFESIVNSRLGVDCAQMRDTAGRPIIPAAQVKGVLRDVLEMLAERTDIIGDTDVKVLFGVSSVRNGEDTNLPVRGMAIFSDLVARDVKPDARKEPALHTTRIEIDDDTGTVKTGAVQVIELAAPFGTKVTFSGTLTIRYRAGLDREKCENAISKALRLIPAIGALKSAGFGAVDPEGCRLECTDVKNLVLNPGEPSGRIAYHVAFDRPLLVAARSITDNLFESAKIIPGAVFKGALAERLALAGIDPENDTRWGTALAQLRISHAFPLKNGIPAELPIPASLVFKKVGKDDAKFADAIICRLGDAPMWDGEAAQFVAGAKSDIREEWKKHSQTPEWGVELLPRTHIAVNEIGSGTGANRIISADRTYTAAEHMLYATVMLPTEGHKWALTVDAGDVADKECAAQFIAALEEGLDGVGKTGACAQFARDAESFTEPDKTLPDTGTVDIMLKTPAVLFDPTKDQEESMHARFEEYFRTQFDELLTLENVFARQDMVGGYQAIRRRPFGAYYPFVVTEPGAVFRLRFTSPKGRDKLAEALRCGLPVPDLDGKKPDWNSCPFVRENGYAEITLHKPKRLEQGVLEFVKEVGA